MFDNLSKKALRDYLPRGRKWEAENFDTAIHDVFSEEMVGHVKKLIGALGVKYEHPLRVIDKYLYLRGGRIWGGQYWIDRTQWMLENLGRTPSHEEIAPIAVKLLPGRD